MLSNATTTFESECSRLALEARSLVRRYGKDKLKCATEVDGWWVNITARPLSPDAEIRTSDLPKELGKKPAPMLRRTYRILRVLRAERGRAARIQAGDIAERWASAFPSIEPNLGTIKQMLNLLKRKGVIFHSDERGWVFESPQGSLFAPAKPERCPLARSQFVWVPGDLCASHIIVVDSITNRAVEATGWDGTYLRFTDWKDRVKDAPAVRAELVEREGRHLLVKLSNGERVYTPVLGDWHLEGRSSNEDSESN